MFNADFILPGTEATKIKASLCYNLEENFFGCHSKGIANIRVGLDVLSDTKKELNWEYGAAMLRDRQRKVALSYIEENLLDKLYAQLRVLLRGYSVVFMSGACNTEDGKPEKVSYSGPSSTAGFAAWLRNQGEFIMATPLLTNVNHLLSGFSLLRAWMWVPSHINTNVRHIEGTEYISGKSKSAVPFPEWWEFYQKFHNGKRSPLNTFTPDDLVSSK